MNFFIILKGYGKSLLINILDRLKKYKVRWIGLTVANDNKNALHLYNSLGFKNPKDIDEYNGHALTYKSKFSVYLLKKNS